MATILLQVAGTVAGSAFGPIGAMAGRAFGALAGSVIDSRLFGGGTTTQGQHLGAVRLGGVDEGAPLPRAYGSVRLGGTLIWATRFEEVSIIERTGSKASGTKTETFSYFGNFAFGICEGPIAAIRRVWVDGRELDLTTVEMRVYTGREDQMPDPLIEAKQGSGNAPAYRGLAYVVFERLPLDDYGNRIPVVQFEVLRPTGRLENEIRAITIIPGATEHGLCPYAVTEISSPGSQRILNRNNLMRATDWEASIDELMALCPNLESVALVVAWFGDDLRAGNCTLMPGVETLSRNKESSPWRVSGITRSEARLISTNDGGAAYGGTPNDAGLIAAIADLKARGLKVFLYPFVMMDIPNDNTLPNPYGGSPQPAYPWRGRITCDPAIGATGTVDQTSQAADQLAAFLGSAAAGQFTAAQGSISYSGTGWGYRRFILHYAHLAEAAGGVDGIIIGSEMRALTAIRDEYGSFPFVDGLVSLAGAVRSVVGTTTALTYAADWSEYFGYHAPDGDVFFNLDPLWACEAIDAIGIDNYMPLSDWRDEDLASASPDGFRLANDLAALRRNITSGEGFDWYYASSDARDARQRTPITDGLAGKPWVFRYKDIENWWSNYHHERRDGAENATPTAWQPGMKPVWFTELGCPAIDAGANQPNVFFDPKSTESALPYFSSGTRSDASQRRFVEAHLGYWESDDALAGMVDPGKIFLWCWDARPFPAFPSDTTVWSDGANWLRGHWLNGRLGASTLGDTIETLLTDHGFDNFDAGQVSDDLIGYQQAELASARDLLDPLLEFGLVDVCEDGGVLTFRSRLRASLPPAELPVLVDSPNAPQWSEKLLHEAEIAGEVVAIFSDAANDYEQATVRSSRTLVDNDRVAMHSLPAVFNESGVRLLADNLLRDGRIAKRELSFSLSPQRLELELGDVVSLSDGPAGRFLVTRLEQNGAIEVTARAFSPSVSAASSGEQVLPRLPRLSPSGFAPRVILMDLARFNSDEAESFARIAAYANPWQRLVLSSSSQSEGYSMCMTVDRPASTGSVAASLGSGVSGRFDYSQSLVIALDFGAFASASKLAVLNGSNRLAVRAANGQFEIIGYLNAEETAPGLWSLSGLLRGLAGTEDAMTAGAEIGADAVLLNQAVVSIELSAEARGLERNYLVETSLAQVDPAAPYAFTGGLRAEMPLSPVHLRGQRNGGNDVAFSWVRRSRIDADDWAAFDIPLDEDSEAYRLEILVSGSVARLVEIDTTAFIYTEDMQLADFGSVPEAISVRLYQLGRKVPFGVALERTIQF
ncbi:glycoside hydrolase/phage tail family protein [Martelella sp. HB161492]|uniref:baseplate multidomain protein megatron n=1 Tax=Martelella sp. HB161492 TaxID=2720726 RepID=UPI00159118D9|nr:glycoside hydrolase/phage tail family protein [Martelella sp. HB161492]